MKPFAKQYYLTKEDRNVDWNTGWGRWQFGEYVLRSDLPVKQKTGQEGAQIILIGVVYSVVAQKTQQESFDELSFDLDQLKQQLYYLSGNYIVLHKSSKGDASLIGDVAMQIRAYYTTGGTTDCIASDPNLIKAIGALELDDSPEAKTFYESDYFKRSRILVSDATKYRHLKQLLPNHELCVCSRKVKRFFPNQSLAPISKELAVERLDSYFSQAISNLVQDYRPVVSLTCGLDSRMVFCALRGKIHQAIYYTYRMPSRLKMNHPDITIPQQMSRDMGFDFEVWDLDEDIDADTVAWLDQSFSDFPHSRMSHVSDGMVRLDFDRDLNLMGTLSEVAKSYFEDVHIHDGLSYAKGNHFPVMKYVVDVLDVKIKALIPVAERYGYDVRDLAHWEQDICNFAGQNAMFNMHRVISYSPFSSRAVLDTVLAVPRSMRDKQQHEFYNYYMNTVWPELQRYPINPMLKRRLIVLAKRLGIYKWYKRMAMLASG